MPIWVDADACPKVIKEILYRAAERAGIALTLIANHALQVPPSPLIKSMQVPAGFDIADNEIIKRVRAGDLVVTADIPLASAVIEAGALALNPRGELYTTDNIKQRLNMRDFMDELRGAGVQTGGPPPLSQRERHAFAGALDRYIHSCGD